MSVGGPRVRRQARRPPSRRRRMPASVPPGRQRRRGGIPVHGRAAGSARRGSSGSCCPRPCHARTRPNRAPPAAVARRPPRRARPGCPRRSRMRPGARRLRSTATVAGSRAIAPAVPSPRLTSSVLFAEMPRTKTCGMPTPPARFVAVETNATLRAVRGERGLGWSCRWPGRSRTRSWRCGTSA